MTVRPIRLFGDPVLTSVAKEVPATEFGSDSLRTQVADMLETMDAAGGVGLAANQIGKLNRVFVFDTSHQPSGIRGHIVNPTWTALGDERQLGPEGCLSIPEISAEVDRAAQVVARGVDLEGRPMTIVASGLLARCLQHEADHLDGILYLKRLSSEQRKLTMAEIRASDWFNTDTPGKDA